MCLLDQLCSISADDLVPEFQKWDDHPARKEWEPLEDLGSGSFSQVVLARHRPTGRLAALKVVFLGNPEMDAETRSMLSQEGDLLKSLNHPNIVGCSEIIHSPRADVLVLEYLAGCNVLDGLYRLSHKYTERDAAGIFTQLASAVAYLHSQGIIHRDVKPENLVYAEMPRWAHEEETKTKTPFNNHSTKNSSSKTTPSTKPKDPIVKLVDLGMSWKMNPTLVDRGVLGSAGFVAPEIVKGAGHTPAMDVFSMGVLLFIMLVGRKPFNIGESENLKYARIPFKDAPGLKDPRWLDLSPDAKDLVMGMLRYDPERRLTAEQVLKHEWIATSGGLTVRMLGADVAMGAATVAEIRRLRFLCSGTVALQRAAGATVMAKNARKGKPSKAAVVAAGQGSTTEHAKYIEELKRTQKREASVRNGSALRDMARTITAKSYGSVHDTGGSVHRRVLGSSVHGNAPWQSRQDEVAKSQKHQQGMQRSATALFLGELLTATSDASVGDANRSAAGSWGGMQRSNTTGELSQLQQQPSGFQMLASSVKQYIDVSVHGKNKMASREASRSLDLDVGADTEEPSSSSSKGRSAGQRSKNPSGAGSDVVNGNGTSTSDELPKVVQVRWGSTPERLSYDGGEASLPKRTSADMRRVVHAIQPLN